MLHVDTVNHVNHIGSVSLITTPVAVAGHALRYESVYTTELQKNTHVLFTVLVIERSTVGVTVVVTVLEVLFPVLRSSCDHVIVAKLLNVPHVAETVQVIVIVHTHPLKRLHILYVNTFHAMLHVEATSPVKPAGSVSIITIHVAVAGQALA